MAGVEHGHVVLLGDEVDAVEEVCKGFVVVYVFFAVGGEEEVFSFFESQSLVDVRGPDSNAVCCQYFCHGGAGHVDAFFGEAHFDQVAAGGLGIGQVYVGCNINDLSGFPLRGGELILIGCRLPCGR